MGVPFLDQGADVAPAQCLGKGVHRFVRPSNPVSTQKGPGLLGVPPTVSLVLKKRMAIAASKASAPPTAVRNNSGIAARILTPVL
jgi:hypothetical protein